ncbi:MAG: hypothetical protein AB7F75_10315 [Planctomycetota bacterium]
MPSSTAVAADPAIGSRLWWLPLGLALVFSVFWTPWECVWDGHFFFSESTSSGFDVFHLSYFQNPGAASADAFYRPLDRLRLEAGYRWGGWLGVILPMALLHILGTWGMMRLMGPGSATLALAILYAVHPLFSEPLHYLPGQADVAITTGLVWILLLNRSGLPIWALIISLVAPWLKESAWVLPLIHLAHRPPRCRWHGLAVIGMACLWYGSRPEGIGLYRHADNLETLIKGLSVSVTMLPRALMSLVGVNLEERGHFVLVDGVRWLALWILFPVVLYRLRGHARLFVALLLVGTLQHVLAVTEDASGQLWMPWSSRFYVLSLPVLILWVRPRLESGWTSLRAAILLLTACFCALMHVGHAGYWSNDVVLWRSMTRESVGIKSYWHNRVMAEWMAGHVEEARAAAEAAGRLGLVELAQDERFKVR